MLRPRNHGGGGDQAASCGGGRQTLVEARLVPARIEIGKHRKSQRSRAAGLGGAATADQ